MDQRFEVRKRQLVEQAELRPEVTRGMLKRLRQFAEPFVGSLRRPESKEHGQVYLAGLLSDLKRKNVESIAYRYDLDRGNLQRATTVLSSRSCPLKPTNSTGSTDERKATSLTEPKPIWGVRCLSTLDM